MAPTDLRTLTANAEREFDELSDRGSLLYCIVTAKRPNTAEPYDRTQILERIEKNLDSNLAALKEAIELFREPAHE